MLFLSRRSSRAAASAGWVELESPPRCTSVPKRDKPFNNPFAALKLPKPTDPPPSQPEKAPPADVRTFENEGELFRASVGAVNPIPGSERLPPENGRVSAD